MRSFRQNSLGTMRERDVAEVAQLLKIDAQTVRSTHHKALLRLREHFGGEAP